MPLTSFPLPPTETNSDLPEEQRSNALLLEQTLYRHGFRGYSKEWWHFTDLTDYPVVNE
ncbi:MAG: hypothetical protein IJZ33_05720 [Clostridia bacterium]|nr:hypothetical protein [Clostridia bacterium]